MPVILQVSMWYCGDECCCSEPVAEVIGPNPLAEHMRCKNAIVVDKGEFHTDSEEDRAGLKTLADKYGVELDEDGYGARLATPREIAVYEAYCVYHKQWVAEQNKRGITPFAFDGITMLSRLTEALKK